MDELGERMAQKPENFPDGFIKAFKIYREASGKIK